MEGKEYVVKDGDVEEGQEFDEEEVTKRVIRLLDKVRKIEGQSQKVREEIELGELGVGLRHVSTSPRG